MSEGYTENREYNNKNTSKKDIIIAAGIQLDCRYNKKNIPDRAESYLKQAFEHYPDIDLVILPEQFYKPSESSDMLSEKEVRDWLKSLARKYHVNVVGGSFACRSEQDGICKDGNSNKDSRHDAQSNSVVSANKNTNINPFNICYVMDREGRIVGSYKKIHLFDAFNIKESDEFSPGDTLGIFDLDIGRIGVWICYDSRFPEVARALSRSGADLFCVPAAFYKPHSEQWEILLKAASVMNVTPLIAVNQIGDLPDGKGFFGRSMAIDAKGVITAGISDKEGYFVGEIDKAYTRSCREANPELRNRRIDLYRNWL